MAPMIGLTEHVFRKLYTQHFSGVDFALSPFITLVEGKKIKLSHLRDVFPENNTNLPIVPQIIGNNSKMFITMANQLANMGYNEVNWNLGCPIKRIAIQKKGSGLLPYPDIIDAIFEKLFSEVKCKISVKVRLGYNNSEEINSVIPVLNKYPLSSVTIHPRTGIQLYGGKTDPDTFAKIYKQIEAPIIYNGDIFTYQDYSELHKRFPEIESWMLGRGIIYNPFLPEIIKSGKEIPAEKAKQRFEEYNRAMFDYYLEHFSREQHFLNKMKAYWDFFNHQYINDEKIFYNLKICTTRKELELVFEEIYKNEEFKPVSSR